MEVDKFSRSPVLLLITVCESVFVARLLEVGVSPLTFPLQLGVADVPVSSGLATLSIPDCPTGGESRVRFLLGPGASSSTGSGGLQFHSVTPHLWGVPRCV